MQIYSKNAGPLRPETARTTPVDAPDRDSVRPTAPVPSSTDRSDKVEISSAGRALAARGGDSASPLDSARTTAIRGRVLNGAYDTLEVVDAVARRLLDSGDL